MKPYVEDGNKLNQIKKWEEEINNDTEHIENKTPSPPFGADK
jgi:hypothetical protein